MSGARPAGAARAAKEDLVPPPNNIGKVGKLHNIDGRVQRFVILDEIIQPQRLRNSSSRKLIYLQRIKFEEDGAEEYRFCYYMVGVKPKTRGRWVFGQFALLIPARDLRVLPTAARAKGWKPFKA